MRDIIKKSVTRIVIISFIIIAFFFICKLLYESSFLKNTLKDNSSIVESDSSIFNLEVGNYYEVVHQLHANNESAENGADTPEFNINANESVLLIQLEGKYAKVEYKDNFGWIPAWYLSDEAQNVILLSSFLLTTKEQSDLYLYPEGDIAYDKSYYLEEDRIVKVMAEFKTWYLVDFLRYDNPEYDLLWISKDKTTAYTADIAKEGYLRENAVFCTKEGILTDESIEGYITIISEENGLYKIKGTGGQRGYIKKSDLLHFDLDTYSRFLSP